jgi:hypothetical protein
MGVIDQVTHTLTCHSCGATEAVTLMEHGSAYGGLWQSGKSMSMFVVTWAKTGFMPSITSAKCKKCGAQPVISVS